MSGGHFDYKQHALMVIADEIRRIISINDSKETDKWGYTIGYGYSEEIINFFKETANMLEDLYKRVHDIDWLLSGDYGEDSLLEIIKKGNKNDN